MFSKLVKWHQEMELEGIRVLEDPSQIDTVKPGIRRLAAKQLANLTPVERQQIAAFSRKYWGWRAYAALAKFIIPFIALGGLVHLLFPKLPLGWSLLGGGLVGIELLAMGILAWFNYSKLTGKNQFRWILRFVGYLLLCATVGFVAGMLTSDKPVRVDKLIKAAPYIASGLLGLMALIVLPIVVVGNLRAREAQAIAREMEQKVEQERLQRELSEAQLRLLRAQIEPHFLFNTLGAVQQLAEQGAPRAAALTADLIAFLRATSTEMRRDSNTLRDEFQLVQAYLNVMQARMGKRLQYSIDLPEALAGLTVPSMSVLTLAENAIKHGIEPSLRGGMIQVAARKADGNLAVTVSDDGAGMAPVPGKGMGLDNVRSRIAIIHGSAARLDLVDGEQGGVRAEMILPGAAA
jgi:sensor histidine kinase YesM